MIFVMATIDKSQTQVCDTSHGSSQSRALDQVVGENAQLLHRERHKSRIVCLKSKPAILLLVWSFLVNILQWNYSPYSFITIFGNFLYNVDLLKVIVSVYAFFALFQLVYPVAGLLADIRYGRFKCVIGNLWAFVIGCCFLPILTSVSLCPLYLPFESWPWSYAILAAILAIVGIPAVICIFLLFSSIAAFNANVIQFGLDQLHDSSTEHLVLYIHWYVMLSFAGTIFLNYSSYMFYISIGTLSFWPFMFVIGITLICCFFILCISLFIGCCKHYSWFLPDPESKNPYKLVHNVVCFARKHNSPIQRSAFTYCEDELPSRLDLGKEKYGGPFTTEQVEDVKVFVNILKVLVSLGPLFTIERSANILQHTFSMHLSGQDFPSIESIFFLDFLPMIFSIILLIFYITVLRPYVSYYIPSILKRILFGIVLLTMPSVCFFILDTVGHLDSSHSTECFLTNRYSLILPSNGSEPLDINYMFLFVPSFFVSCGFMVFHIAVFEFICSQSPHSMKGLLIGTFYAIRGIFQLLGALLFMFPFLGWRSSSFPSCGFAFYLINISVALIGIVAYTWAARRYQNRQRDEPDNTYRYAEEYYDKSQDEPSPGYDNYDNLDVHTIG